MSDTVKRINQFFKSAIKSEIKQVEDELVLDEHLQKVLVMFYKERKDIDYIAFKLGYSRGKIESDLRTIRLQLSKLV